MKHTTRIEIANERDQILAEAGVIKPEEVRRVIVEDALVDTGATRLCLPKSLISKLGLRPVGTSKSMTANGMVDRTVYSEVEFTLLERKEIIRVTDLPDNAPVLVGHMILELLDLCVDMKKGLIYNPDHGDDWIEYQLPTLETEFFLQNSVSPRTPNSLQKSIVVGTRRVP